MATSTQQIQAMIDLAKSLYNAKGSTKRDLEQCESLFLRVLDSYQTLYGNRAEVVGWTHNWLGLVYHKLDNPAQFEKGEAHFSAAEAIYTDKANLSIVTNNHASLLVKKAAALQTAAQANRDKSRQARPQTRPEAKSRLARIFSKTPREEELQDARVIEQLEEALELSQQAAHAFKKAEALRDRSRTLQNEAQQSHNQADAEADEDPENKAADIVYRSPAAILDDLNKVVVGQMATKRGLANAASQHLRRILLNPDDRAKTDKANVLIVGPTGCGKTLLTQALSQAMNVPFYRTEATKLTASGYVGEDVHSVLAGLLRSCDWNVERAQHGIIYIDEIDKVTAHDTNGQFDVRGKAVQEELLTILEGTKVTVTKDGKRTGEPVEIDTTNILFIVGGAFTGLGELIRQRLSANDSTIGFGAALRKKEADASSYVKYASAEDFVSFGLIPEFVGRLPKRLSVTTLTVAELKRILLEPKKALLQQKRLLLAPTTDLRFSESALTAIAEEAHKTGTNGRALLEIVEQVLDPIIFAEPASVVVTAAMVLNRSAEISACQQESTTGIAPLSFDFIVADDQATDQIAAETAPAAAATTRRVGVLLTGTKN